jgi:hypothetical protein
VPPDTDYSATPLWRKLGIAEGSRVHVRGAPDDLQLDALAPLPPTVTFLTRPGRDLDVVLTFVTGPRQLDRVGSLARSLTPAGRLWVAWPKKTSGIATELSFAAVQSAGLDVGLVDNKSASITDAFQGLQFVRRLKDRPREHVRVP